MNAKALFPILLLTALLEGKNVFGDEAAVLQARREIEAGRLEAAIRALDERLERRPGDVEALKVRALAASGLGRYEEAVHDYERALEKKPKDAQTHRDLGMLLAFKMKNVRHASEHLDRYLALRKNPDIPSDVGRAFKILDQKCSKQEQRIVDELMRMAQAFEATGKTKVAIRTYERALKIRPACIPCRESLSRLNRRRG